MSRKTIDQEWITDRLPTKEDESVDKEVWVPCSDEDGFYCQDSDNVYEGDPWMSIPKAPKYVPKRTPEQWFELLPDGYRELAIEKIESEHVFFWKYPKSLKQSILHSFPWGINDSFWFSVYKSINEDNTIDYDRLPPLPNKKTSVTLQEISDKFNIPVDKLIIKSS